MNNFCEHLAQEFCYCWNPFNARTCIQIFFYKFYHETFHTISTSKNSYLLNAWTQH